MARQTRAQRRARRSEMTAGEAALPGGPPAPPPRPTARAQPEPSREPRGEPRAVPGSGVRRFIGESWGELKKVEWPGQSQLIQGVVVVLLACFIVGIFLYTCDLVFKRLIQQVFT